MLLMVDMEMVFYVHVGNWIGQHHQLIDLKLVAWLVASRCINCCSGSAPYHGLVLCYALLIPHGFKVRCTMYFE